MPTCFVIQPFDNGKFDKRFEDVYKPAIEAAGLEAYRVDKDPRASVPIESIEKGIREAFLCLADITEDNPNVWYELGFSFAANRQVIMVCAEDRTGKRYPFDIQHRSIISYKSDAPRDFEALRSILTERMKVFLDTTETLERIAEADPVNPIEGLSQTEITVLAVIAGSASLPSSSISVYSAKTGAENAGITNMGFNLAVRMLTKKSLIEFAYVEDHFGNEYKELSISEAGWEWVEKNKSRFVLHHQPDNKTTGGDIPF